MKVTLMILVALGILSFSSESKATNDNHAGKVELALDYPVAMGNMGQNFNSNLGVNAAFYADSFIDPAIRNFLSIGYDSFTLRADQRSSFRVFPILVGLDAPGTITKDFRSTFGVAAGGSITYLNVVNSQSYKAYGYFTAQVKAGLEYNVSSGISLLLRTPITFLLGSKPFSYVSYNFGVQYQF